MSPTVKSLDYLRKQGYIAQSVEKYNAFTHRRNDLFGFIDVVAVKPGEVGVLGVQVTGGGNGSSRIKKILELPEHNTWLAAQNRIEVHDWVKRGKAGKRKLWTVNRTGVGFSAIEGQNYFSGEIPTGRTSVGTGVSVHF